MAFDGADMNLTKQWMQEGHLPNLDRLQKIGCFQPLVPPCPPQTPRLLGVFFHRKKSWKDNDIRLSEKRPQYLYAGLSHEFREQTTGIVGKMDSRYHCTISRSGFLSHGVFQPVPYSLHKDNFIGRLRWKCDNGLRNNIFYSPTLPSSGKTSCN